MERGDTERIEITISSRFENIELVQVIAKEQQLAPTSIAVDIEGTMDRSKPVRQDLTVFNAVTLRFQLAGVTQAQAVDLIERFKAR